MSKSFHLNIKTPEQIIFSGEAEILTLDTEEIGRMQVLSGHASLTGNILASPIHIKIGDKKEKFFIRRGAIMISNEKNTTTILALNCEKLSEITYQTVQEYLKLIEMKLENNEDLTPYQLTHLQKEKIAIEHTLKKINS